MLAVTVVACNPVDNKTTRPDTPWYLGVVEPVQSDPDRIARFYDRLLTMKASELSGELEMIRGSFERDRSDVNRLKLALVLSLPGTTLRNDDDALALLVPFVKGNTREDSTLRPLAILLYSELLELRRKDEVMQEQGAKLKEELRRTDEALQQQAAKLKEEQRRAEALQHKLDAILDMEMQIIEREQNLPKKK